MELARNVLGVTEETQEKPQAESLGAPIKIRTWHLRNTNQYKPLAKTWSIRGLFSQRQYGRSFKLIPHIHIEQRPLNAFFV